MIQYFDREQKKVCEEKVFGGKLLKFLYGPSIFGRFFRNLIAKNPFFSNLAGYWYRQSWTKKSIIPFIDEYEVDASEFLKPPSQFTSFNDFFTRQLKLGVRPIDPAPHVAIIPADARYWFYENVDRAAPFHVKGEILNLNKLFNSNELSQRYQQGSAVFARLCPSDYHRFHFPCKGVPSVPRLVNGYLFSVNPIAIGQNLKIFWMNKRMLTLIETENFGTIAYFEIGATAVGTIHETFQPYEKVFKGEEKGYFSFGGSSLILLFEKGKIQFCPDLIEATHRGMEIRCLFGQRMGFDTAKSYV